MAEITPIGQLALHYALQTNLPLPTTRSATIDGARRTVVSVGYVDEFYPRHYSTDGSLIGNIRFALKHEPLDLRIIHAALVALGELQLIAWLRDEHTGIFSRRAWFFYETLTGNVVDIDDVLTGNYVDALDPRKHFVAPPRNSKRHRVRDNLLGTRDFCPVVRRTAKIEAMIASDIKAEAMALTTKYSAEVLARSANFLITKETRSSFAIEGETPSSGREERFAAALRSVPSFIHDRKESIIALQSQIVDARYAAKDWRDFQNFVGETTSGLNEHVHYVCPRPDDVPVLMNGWMLLTQRLIDSSLDPVIAAGVSAFAFVFVHPFEDGNGRIHRFIVHYMLAKCGFSPPGVVFPISASILRQMHLYDKALEAFSEVIMPAIDWKFTLEGQLEVRNDTSSLYRFFDATPQVEFLYDRVLDTVRVDFKKELEFLDEFDRALAAVQSVIDMPDRRAALLAKLCIQNKGRLSVTKRPMFGEITDEEIRQVEEAIATSRREGETEGVPDLRQL